MATRFFRNDMPEFVAEKTVSDELALPVIATSPQESLMRLLSMPYKFLSDRLKVAALDLKETVSFISLSLPSSSCFLVGLF